MITLSEFALTDVETVKLLLGISAEDTSQDAMLQLLINYSSSLIESKTGRKFKLREDQVEYYDGPGDSCIVVRNRPIIAVNHLYVDGNRLFTSDTELSQAAPNIQFVVDGEAGLIELTGTYPFFNDVFGKAPRIIKLDYDYGYDPVPDDIATACAILAADYKQNNKNINVKSVTIGSFSQTYGDAKAIPDKVLQAMLPYMDIPMVG